MSKFFQNLLRNPLTAITGVATIVTLIKFVIADPNQINNPLVVGGIIGGIGQILGKDATVTGTAAPAPPPPVIIPKP